MRISRKKLSVPPFEALLKVLKKSRQKSRRVKKCLLQKLWEILHIRCLQREGAIKFINHFFSIKLHPYVFYDIHPLTQIIHFHGNEYCMYVYCDSMVKGN